MDSKHIARIGATVTILLLIVGIIYYGVYMPYKWELTGVVADENGVPVGDAEVTLKIIPVEHGEHGEVEEEGHGHGVYGTYITKTDETGVYSFSSNILKQMPNGLYNITVRKELDSGQFYTGYTGRVQIMIGGDIRIQEQNLLWIRMDEVGILEMYDEGLKFVSDQARPNKSLASASGTGAGVFWMKVDLTGLRDEKGNEYGIQIENAPGNNISTNLMRGNEIVRPGKNEINDSRVVDVNSRIKGKYPDFLNTFVFAGLESAKIREGVYRLTAKQREVIFAPVTIGVLAEDIYDKDGNWKARSNYSDMAIMSMEYFNDYFEVVSETELANQVRVEYRCKDDEAVWSIYKASCTLTQHCENEVAMKYMCGDRKCTCTA